MFTKKEKDFFKNWCDMNENDINNIVIIYENNNVVCFEFDNCYVVFDRKQRKIINY